MLRWPELIAVTGLDSALAAVEEIIEQGEGARGIGGDAHYGRFLQMWEEYHAFRERDPSFDPARPVLAAYARQPFDIPTPMPIITDPLAHRVAELASVAYELVLQPADALLHPHGRDRRAAPDAHRRGDRADGRRRAAARYGAHQFPVGPEHEGKTAGFAFEMYYRMGNFVPWRPSAWALLHERTSALATMCADASEHDGAPGAIGNAGDRTVAITAALAAGAGSRQ